MTPRIATRALLGFLLAACAQRLAAAEGGLTPPLLVDLKRVREVALSPDGERVAYVLSVPRGADEEIGGAHGEVWWVPAGGGEPRPLTSKPGGASALSWSPDGRRVGFIAVRKQHHEKSQVYALPIDGGEAQPLTRHPEGIASYRWSPDGKRLAFLAVDGESEAEKEAKKKGRDWIVNDGPFRFQRPWTLDLEKGESRALYDGPLQAWDFIWAPDGGALYFQGSETPLTDASYMFRRIYSISLAGGAPQKVIETEGKLGPMAVSPDGKRLAYAGAVDIHDPLAQSLFVAAVDGSGPARNLAPGLEASVEEVSWDGDAEVLALAVAGTKTALHRFAAGDGRAVNARPTGVILHHLSGPERDGRLAAIGNAAGHPDEAFVWSRGEDAPRRLTRSNPQLDACRLARQETIAWPARDGLRIEGVLTYPLDYREGARYPLVLQVHGGPEGVSLDGWSSRAVYPVQALAARGFLVLEPNYRGSGGRGVAFSKADHDDLGGAEFDDVLAGIDHLAAIGLADPQRVGTGGWSYGGYFSAWAATRHSKRFRAAIVAAGISNWVSFGGTTDIPHEMALVHWKSYWHERPDLHWQRSPLAHVVDAATPTLIVHGLADDRVPLSQGIELYQTLKLRGVPAELVRYPRQPHGLVERGHQLDFVERSIEWFERYVKGEMRL
jgi:dipeptidyl aminopeptidase/acylaminoacyl peptidase